jgi:hypothetical protein
LTAIADLSEHINRATGGNSGTPQSIFGFYTDRTAGTSVTWTVASLPCSPWQQDGCQMGGGSIPSSTPAAPDNTTLGGILHNDPSGGRQLWLTQFAASASVGSVSYLLYDRLLHQGGLDGTSTSAQTVGGSLTRYTTGEGVRIALEIYTLIGTTARTVTASYTNQAGTSGRTTQAVAFGGTNNRERGRMVLLPLQAGDTGVQSVQNVTISASTGTAGSFGVTLFYPLRWSMSMSAGMLDSVEIGIVDGTGPTEILTDACLSIMAISSTTTPVLTYAQLFMYER